MLIVNGSTFGGKTSSGELIQNGTITGDVVTFTRNGGWTQAYKGRIQGAKIVGTFTGAGGTAGQEYPWEFDLSGMGK
jgi:hypothetical protein